MSKENDAKKTSLPEDEEDQMLFNPIDKEERSRRDSGEEDKMDEFNMWMKKYNHVSKEIRKNTIEQEKKELEELEKSPLVKYYEGTRFDRIQTLREEQKQLEKIERLQKKKK